MSEIKAGVIIKSRFVTPGASYAKKSGYKGYINYMKRPEAIKDGNIENDFGKFNDYMCDNEKSDGIFLYDTNYPTDEEITRYKDMFDDAQNKQSVLHQIVISFDMQYLKDYGVVTDSGINGDLLKDYTRLAISEMMAKEGDMNTFIWSGAIHYNTDNVHIHVGMVDTNPIWEEGKGRCFKYAGKLQQRGVIKLNSLNKAKSIFVNNIIGSKEKNQAINSIMHDSIITAYKADQTLKHLKEYRSLMKSLITKLPQNMGLWKYNMNAINDVRSDIDKITDWLIKTQFEDEYQEFLKLVSDLADEYEKSYGVDEFNLGKFKEGKIKNLYERVGNSILKEAIYLNKNNIIEPKNKSKTTEIGISRITPISDLFFSSKKIKRMIRKDFSSIKNQMIYEKKQQEKEAENRER